MYCRWRHYTQSHAHFSSQSIDTWWSHRQDRTSAYFFSNNFFKDILGYVIRCELIENVLRDTYERNFNFSNQVKNNENFSPICVGIVKKLYTQDVSAVALTDDVLPVLQPPHCNTTSNSAAARKVINLIGWYLRFSAWWPTNKALNISGSHKMAMRQV